MLSIDPGGHTMPEKQSTENLELKIRQQIGDQGPIPFPQFMEMALYDPEAGYYQSKNGIIGAAGDFVTSPEAGPLFGRLIAGYLAGIWRELGSPSAMQIREYGAGQGGLCREIMGFLQAMAPDCFAVLRYGLIERSAAMQERLRRMLSVPSLAKRCSLSDADEFSADAHIPQVVLANEFLDALPVHWVVCRNRGLMEKRVDWLAGEFVLIEKPLETRRLEQYFKWLGVTLAEGQETTVNLAALDWLEKLSAIPSAMRLLIIDYGFLGHDRLKCPGRSNTLACYQNQTSNRRPLLQVGCQDITAHVDFAALIKRSRELGFEIRRFEAQAGFLLQLVSSTQGWFDWEGNLDLRLNLKELVHPEHMGETFRVLELARGMR